MSVVILNNTKTAEEGFAKGVLGRLTGLPESNVVKYLESYFLEKIQIIENI